MNRVLEIALQEFGLKEYAGRKHNPRILEFFAEIGHEWVKDDETAWCSAFMNWVALKAECPRSGKLNARSWLEVGTPVEDPKMGDVVIFWRESEHSWKGHVGIFINRIGDQIYTLGGNQRNSVNIQSYKADRLLGYRRIELCED